MNQYNKPFSGYDSGADFWSDNAISYGIDEAIGICSRYLEMQLKYKLSDDEKLFCYQTFAAMYEATADKVDPAKLVYPYEFKIAGDREETSYFHKNRNMNWECVRDIDAAIRSGNYETNYYNLESAAMSVIGGHGFERVNAVLAYQTQQHEYDGRYSDANKKWAKGFTLPDDAYEFMDSHAILIDGFTEYVRKLYMDLGADRFALPGREEQGEFVHGYQVIRSIMADTKKGYAIGHNPNAVSPYVCWQFYIRDGKRSYNWGIYGEERDAVNGYNARLFVAFN